MNSTFRETLGLTTDGLARVVKHFIYDGVYATPEERIKGGGSLSLTHFFAQEVGLQQKDISGQWDVSHNLQLIYNDVILKSLDTKSILKFVFDSMSSYTCGKRATFFQETAQSLHNMVLKNQKSQQTRFVRSVLRAMHAFCLNCPTFHAIAANEMNSCIKNHDNTGAKAAQKICNELTDGTKLASVIGLCQILEVYAEISLTSQYSNIFPTTVWKAIDKGTNKLRQYAETWVWEKNVLRMCGIGIPSELIDNLLEGKYQPHVTDAQIKRHEAWNSVGVKAKSLINLIEEDLDANELNDCIETPNETTSKLGPGEIIVIGFTEEKKVKVESKMRELCCSLIQGLDKRMKKTELQKMTIHFFGTFSPDLQAITSDELQSLIDNIPGPHSESYSAVDCLPGYVSWQQFGAKEKERNENLTHEKIWEKYVEKHGDSFPEFVDLYEDINIRTMSEAMAETVGSIMNAAISRGRNPHPFNLSIEICLRFNLPPLHNMGDLIEEILAQRLKDKAEYIRRLESKRPDKLISSLYSASVHNFRENEEKSSHLPVVIWQKK